MKEDELARLISRSTQLKPFRPAAGFVELNLSG